MINEKYGHIRLFKSIQDHWIWPTGKYSRLEAFLYLLIRANYKEKEVRLGYEIIKVKKGEFITSQNHLMNKFSWGKEKTRNFLKLLEKSRIIELKTDRQKTIIKIKDYGLYQGETKFVKKHRIKKTDHKQTSNRPQTDTDKKDKKDKKDKIQDTLPLFLQKKFSKFERPEFYMIWEKWKNHHHYNSFDNEKNDIEQLYCLTNGNLNIVVKAIDFLIRKGWHQFIFYFKQKEKSKNNIEKSTRNPKFKLNEIEH